MNAHAQIATENKLASLARRIVAEGTDKSGAAQLYLENLAHGYYEPDELLAEIAEEDAREDYRGVVDRRNGREDWGRGCGFDDWFGNRCDDYMAARRSTVGMA